MPVTTLTTFAYGGEGMGRLPDGRAVFVPYTIPGEEVRLRLVESRRGFARGELVEILSPAAERVQPRCLHFQACGGCHYQHMPYERQLAAKTLILQDQLERIGGIPNPPVRPAIASPQPWGYRNSVQFHLTPEGKLGFHAPRSKEVIPIQECHILEAPLGEIWPLLDVEPVPGLERVHLRLGAGEEVLLALESGDLQPPEFFLDLPISAVYLGPEGPQVLAGFEHLIFEVSGRPFRVSAESFFQVNTLLAGAMVQHLLEEIRLTPEATVLDLYCGVGLFSAFFAPRAGRLIGVEASLSACEDFIVNLDEFNHVELVPGAVEDVLPLLDVVPELILVDPPRSGLSPQALDGILALAPPVLVYISCDPATLGRDARRLVQGGYALTQVTPFDLFPQTYHIESISFWRKQGESEIEPKKRRRPSTGS